MIWKIRVVTDLHNGYGQTCEKPNDDPDIYKYALANVNLERHLSGPCGLAKMVNVAYFFFLPCTLSASRALQHAKKRKIKWCNSSSTGSPFSVCPRKRQMQTVRKRLQDIQKRPNSCNSSS